MKPVRIYTTMMCPFCTRAMKLLSSKGVKFEEIKAGFDAQKKAQMIQESGGRRTFPQIFIGDTHVGGCDELMAIERAGKLDAMLNAA